MNTDNRTNESTIEASARIIYDHSAVNDEGNVCQCGHETGHDLAYHQAERLHDAGRLVGEPTDTQVEAAAKAIWERYAGHGLWLTLSDARKSPVLKDARAALVAAQEAAPQAATAHSPVHFKCDCVPNLGPPHCHACSDEIGNPVMWSACPNAVPALPSSGVDEDKLAEVIGGLGWGYMVDGPSAREITRAVVAYLGGES